MHTCVKPITTPHPAYLLLLLLLLRGMPRNTSNASLMRKPWQHSHLEWGVFWSLSLAWLAVEEGKASNNNPIGDTFETIDVIALQEGNGHVY